MCFFSYKKYHLFSGCYFQAVLVDFLRLGSKRLNNLPVNFRRNYHHQILRPVVDVFNYVAVDGPDHRDGLRVRFSFALLFLRSIFFLNLKNACKAGCKGSKGTN